MRDYSKVLLATPIRGNVTVTLYTAGIVQSSGMHGGWLPMAGQSDIYVARNVLANEFLRRKEFDTLIFIDSDIGFSRDHLKALIDSDEPMVSGLYTDKCQPPVPFCRDNNGIQLPLDQIPAEGMLPARFVPGGFLKVERIVFETLIAKRKDPRYPKEVLEKICAEIEASDLSKDSKAFLKADLYSSDPLVTPYGGKNFHQFYFGRVVMDNLLSEDYSFSDLVYQAGIQPWMNCGIRVNHDGRTLDAQPPPPKTDTIPVPA